VLTQLSWLSIRVTTQVFLFKILNWAVRLVSFAIHREKKSGLELTCENYEMSSLV
jgi:hypothetical protein